MKKTQTKQTANTAIYQYLELQPLEASDDGIVSDLDEYLEDETIDLNEQIDEATFEQKWDDMIESLHDDPEKLTFSED